jgi:hypothetical protein
MAARLRTGSWIRARVRRPAATLRACRSRGAQMERHLGGMIVARAGLSRDIKSPFELNRLSQCSVSSRDRLRTALKHREPDRIPPDFGSTDVTGIHVTCVAALRDYYGLPRGPAKVYEPFQMLGAIDDDLCAALGLEVIGVFPRKTKFRRSRHELERFGTFAASKCWCPAISKQHTSPNGDILVYPQGDLTAAPSGRMPVGSPSSTSSSGSRKSTKKRLTRRTTWKNSDRWRGRPGPYRALPARCGGERPRYRGVFGWQVVRRRRAGARAGPEEPESIRDGAE